MKSFFVIVFCLNLVQTFCQSGGNGVYTPLKLPNSGRQAALGNASFAYNENDLGLHTQNPATLTSAYHKHIAINLNTYIQSGLTGNFSAGYSYKNYNFALSYQYMDYGKMDAYSVEGLYEGTLAANESFLTLTASKIIKPRLNAGLSIKGAYSILGSYVSNGVMLDAGLQYYSKDSLFRFGVSARNAGFMISTYVRERNIRERMPFEMQCGFAIKPKHAPFRLHMLYHHLNRWDITYSQYVQSNTLNINTGQTEPNKEANVGQKLIRHFNVGLELVLGKNFSVLTGYNLQRRIENAPNVRKGPTGFSFGLQFKIKKVAITYSSASYFPGLNMNLFTFSTNISDFKRKK